MHTESQLISCLWNFLYRHYTNIKHLLFILSLKTSKTYSVLKEHFKSADTQKGRAPSVASLGNNYKEVAKSLFTIFFFIVNFI